MQNNDHFEEQTDFGFTKVSFDQKRSLVGDVFSNVANEYDIMNDLMSLGIHRLWKDQFVKQIPNVKANILDMASGTGDIAFRIINRARKNNVLVQLTLCDINNDMLEIARGKAINRNILQGLEYVVADAEKLPFADNSFDYYTVAFGIRNMAKIDQVLAESYRVLKPNGRFLCLEFSKIEYAYLRQLYQLYSFNIIPEIGKIVAKNEPAYQYLVESIDLFPDQDKFAIMLKDAGFKDVSYRNLSFGIASIHTGTKKSDIL